MFRIIFWILFQNNVQNNVHNNVQNNIQNIVQNNVHQKSQYLKQRSFHLTYCVQSRIMFTKSRPPCSPVGQMTFRNETECWFVKTWRPPYRKCCRNRVCGTSCNSVLFGPIKRREKSRLIGKWRQNWELVVFNRRCKVELRLNRVNVNLTFKWGKYGQFEFSILVKFFSLIASTRLNTFQLLLLQRRPT